MASPLVEAHIEGERRLRALVERLVTQIWRGLPGYDRENVDEWLGGALPVVAAAQRASVALTEGYLARALRRVPIGLNPDDLIGAAARNGAPPEEVYQRPLVEMWSKLGDGMAFNDALSVGLNRATSTAATDVQLSMARTAQAVGREDAQIQRFQRVADPGACEFCQAVDGAVLNSDAAMDLHPGCGCSIEVLTEERPITPHPSSVAVHEHGELGPTLISADHSFTTESQALR